MSAAAADAATALASLEFRSVLSRFASGVTLVCARIGAEVHGLTVSSFCSVSLEPPLVLVCVRRDGCCHDFIVRAGTFAVNVLGAGHVDAARRFADVTMSPGERFGDLRHAAAVTGAPVLDDAIAWMDCRVEAVHPGGDHSIIVGEVLAAREKGMAQALVFYGREYLPLG